MELNRRTFLNSALLAVLSAAAFGRKCIAAARNRNYPGQVVPLNPDHVRRPGKWAG